jgi:hypothetical protein
MQFEAGKMYPFKLERKLSERSETTGVDGWKALGLECKSLSGKGPSGEDGGAFLPMAQYAVTMQMKDFPVVATLPASKTGYKLGFESRSFDVKSDSDVGSGFTSLLGAQCKYDDKIARKQMDFEGGDAQKPEGSCYCGTGCASPTLTPEGDYADLNWRLVGESETGRYSLKEYPYLHMCYKVAPKAVVNMVIRGRVGYHNRVQEWSVA